MQPTKVRSMVEAGVMSAVAIIFAMISVYVPLLGSLINTIWPVPIILLGMRHGYKWSIMAVAVSAIMIAILIEPVLAVKTVVGFSLVGIALGHALRSGFGPAKTLLFGALAALVSSVAVLGLMMLLMGINPLNLEMQMMNDASKQVLEVYRGYGMAEEELARMDQMLQMVFSIMRVALPALFILSAVISSYINLACARLVLRRLGQPIAGFGPFKNWAVPSYVLWTAVASGAMIYLGRWQQVELLSSLGINILMVTLIGIFVHGLAVFYFLADKYNLSRLIRSIILLMIFINTIFVLIVLYAGAFDMAMDYRKLRTPRHS
ncbi:MAG: YybS family protein [Negativicutes bacterium]|nr:YybS family protein [Negativicutes bacterium]